MASPWFTYTPQSTPPPQDVQTSNLADNSRTSPSESTVSDATLVSADSAKRRNPSVSSIPGSPFNSTDGTRTEKAAPILVSATSIGFELRDAGLSTRMSVDRQHTSAQFQTPHSPTHKHVGPQLSLSSSTFERDVFASSPTKIAHAIAPISAADNVTPPLSSPDSTTPYAITSAEVGGIVDSPNTRASQSPTVKVSLTQSPEHGRGGKSEKRTPKRYGTGGSSAGSTGSGSMSVVQSRYTDMVFEDVPRTHNLLSSLFTWILLAGFVVLPGTFTTLEGIQSKSGEFEKVLHTINHLPLMVIAFGCCGVGACGMLLLWWRWAHNYVWLLNSIFVPGVLNGLSGVVSTFASIYGAQNGVYGASSIATLAVTGACTIVCGLLTAIYSLWKLDRVKRRHLHEMAQMKSAGDGIGQVPHQYF